MDRPRDDADARASALPRGAEAAFLLLNVVGWLLLAAAERAVEVPPAFVVAWIVALPLVAVPLVGRVAALMERPDSNERWDA